MTRPTAVVFDVGNVLVEWNPLAFYDREIGEARRRALFAEVDLIGVNLAADAGESLRDGIAALAARHPGRATEIRWWHDRWAEIFTPAIPRSVRLLARLKARGVPVFALTNFGAETWETALALYPFLTTFDRVFVSARIRAIKPDPAIYAHVEQETGLAPGALLFADDSAANVAAARARGWHAHHFTGPDGWADRLVAEGLLTAAEAA